MKLDLRMRDLARESGIPASAIRFYLKQGLLPEPVRPTSNSALYGQIHLDSLSALNRIKSLAPELPLLQLKRVMELVEQGIEPEVALSLHRSVAQGTGVGTVSYSKSKFAEELDVGIDLIESMISSKIIVPMIQDGEARFNAADVQVGRAVIMFQTLLPGGLSKVAEVASLLRQASALEMEMRNAAAIGGDETQSASISFQMQEWGNFWHAYLFARFRLQDIQRHGLGVTQSSKQSEEPSK